MAANKLISLTELGYFKTKADETYIAKSSIDTALATTGESDTTVPSSKAVVDYVASQLSASDAMVMKGTVGTGGTVTTLPTTGVTIGDTYKVITNGTYAEQAAKVGDMFIATAATPVWVYVPSGDDIYSGGTLINIDSATLSISHGTPKGASAGTYGPTTAQTPTFGGTANVLNVTTDAYGHVTGASTTTITIPNTIGGTNLGLVKNGGDVTITATGNMEIPVTGVTASNGLSLSSKKVQLGVASASANGAMTSAHYTKLDNLASINSVGDAFTIDTNVLNLKADSDVFTVTAAKGLGVTFASTSDINGLFA